MAAARGKTHEAVYAFLVQHMQQTHGSAPTRREIVRECNLSSLSVASYALDRLVKDGRIKIAPWRSRGIELCNVADDHGEYAGLIVATRAVLDLIDAGFCASEHHPPVIALRQAYDEIVDAGT